MKPTQSLLLSSLLLLSLLSLLLLLLITPVVIAQGNDEIASKSEDKSPATDNWISRLYKDKLAGYNKDARPIKDHMKPSTVSIMLSLKHIDVDEEKQEFLVNAWSIMTWQDEFLHWVPKDYMNIERIHFDDADIWMPDITIYNSAEGSEAHPFGTVPVLVDHKGNAYWFPPTHLAVKCDLNLREWPRDEHECVVRVGSWAHHGEEIDIQVMTHNGSYGVMVDTLEENSRWQLVNASTTRSLSQVEEEEGPYIELNFTFKIKRQARTIATYITQSTLAVVVLVVASYAVPLRRFLSRLLMHLFSLVILVSCFLGLFTIMPTNGGPVPLVVRYYSGSIVLTLLSLLTTLFITSRVCCCCCGSNTTTLSKMVSIVSHPSTIKNIINKQNSSSVHSPYSHLENEMNLGDEDEEEDEGRRPRATQLNRVENGRGGVVENGDGTVNNVPSHQFLQVINFLMFVLFGIAFVVDYIVLRNVTA